MKRIGAVLLLLVLTRCSDQPVQPKLPEQQTSPKAQLELQSDGLYCTPSGATLTSGALFQVCFNPGNWNRDLIVFIPGYHDPARDPSLPEPPTTFPRRQCPCCLRRSATALRPRAFAAPA